VGLTRELSGHWKAAPKPDIVSFRPLRCCRFMPSYRARNHGLPIASSSVCAGHGYFARDGRDFIPVNKHERNR
jgi:hypothetical protein